MALLSRTKTAETATETAGNGAPAAGPESFDVINPATGASIATLPVDGGERVHEVAERLRRNQPEWEALGIKGRRVWLNKLRDWLHDNNERIADTMQAETGKV